MIDTAAFGSMDVNSKNQMWSRWIFGIEADPSKTPFMKDCIENSRRFFAKLFGRAGRARCEIQGTYYVFTVEVEGVAAHDPDVQKAVTLQFMKDFMHKGFGHSAHLKTIVVSVLAGDRQDGTPPDQMIVLPFLDLRGQLRDG